MREIFLFGSEIKYLKILNRKKINVNLNHVKNFCIMVIRTLSTLKNIILKM